MNMIIIQVDHPDHPHQTDHLTTLITLSSPTIWLLWPFWPPWLQWLLLTGTIIWKFCKTKISRNILRKKIENDNLQKVCPEQQFTNNDLERQKLIIRTGYLQKVLIIIKSKLINSELTMPVVACFSIEDNFHPCFLSKNFPKTFLHFSCSSIPIWWRSPDFFVTIVICGFGDPFL